jgi:cell wall-associated NlpC family hydrolase
MTRNARTLFLLFLSFVLIAAGAESKKKSGSSQVRKSTPKPTPALTSKDEETPKATSSKSASSPASKKKSSKSPTPSPDDSEAKPDAGKTSSRTTDADATPAPTTTSRRTSSKVKATPAPSESESAESTPAPGQRGMLGPEVASIAPESLVEMRQQPEWVQRLIRDALSLSAQNLGYLFGSSDPEAGGMDCSGTIYYLLKKHGFKDVPRDSRGQYGWLFDKGTLRTVSEEDMARFDHRALRPGDLLFWTGTYSVSSEVPISHVMLYLGTQKETGKPVMWGASDGRSYAGKQRFGVSVFDFKLPRTESKSRFVGFGQLPTAGKL